MKTVTYVIGGAVGLVLVVAIIALFVALIAGAALLEWEIGSTLDRIVFP